MNSSSSVFAARQTLFSQCFVKLATFIIRGWVYLNPYMQLPIFYYLPSERPLRKWSLSLWLALVALAIMFCFYLSEEIHFYLLAYWLTDWLTRLLLYLTASFNFLLKGTHKFTQIFSGIFLIMIFKKTDKEG